MCRQCLTSPLIYSKKFGEYTLMRATKDAFAGGDWKKDEFGLVRQNDPDFYFTSEPLPVKDYWIDRYVGIPEDEENDFWDAVNRACEIEIEIMSSCEDFNMLARLFHNLGAHHEDTRINLLVMQKLYNSFSSPLLKD